MKERPILFSGAMVRALLDGSKTQTRRVMKRQPYISRTSPPQFSDVEVGDLFICPDYCPTTPVRGSVIAECESIGTYHCMGQKTFADKHSPYGVPGDRLYVRETWSQPTTLDPGPTFYRADYPACVPAGFENIPPASEITWKPSIHMPRALSRITLEVADVRVERLQDIDETGAIAEGVEPVTYGPIWPNFEEIHYWRGYMNHERAYRDTALDSFNSLWRSINGTDSWDVNPWVWVIEFNRVTP